MYKEQRPQSVLYVFLWSYAYCFRTSTFKNASTLEKQKLQLKGAHKLTKLTK